MESFRKRFFIYHGLEFIKEIRNLFEKNREKQNNTQISNLNANLVSFFLINLSYNPDENENRLFF